MFNIPGLTKTLSKEQIAKILNTSEDALKHFEEAYQSQCLDNPPDSGNLFDINSRHMAENKRGIISSNIDNLDEVINRIVAELLSLTSVYHCELPHPIKGCGFC